MDTLKSIQRLHLGTRYRWQLKSRGEYEINIREFSVWRESSLGLNFKENQHLRD